MTQRVVIIGAGIDGLVAAHYLAKAGHKPVVLERRETIGGAYAREEFHPGFHASLAMDIPALPDKISADLGLQSRGCEINRHPIRTTTLALNGAPLCIYEDAKRTAAELSRHSKRDGEKYAEFVDCFECIGRALQPVLTMTPPNVEGPTKSELWNLGKLGWKIRGLGKKNEYRLLRYGPMAVADLAGEWFEDELLRAVVAARGIFGAFAGPWSAGTSAPLLLHAAAHGHPVAPALIVKGGQRALIAAIAKAAADAGAEIRTGVAVTSIDVEDGRAVGVRLEGGEQIPAWATVSNGDPGITLLQLIDAAELPPSFRTRVQNYRSHGAVARVDLALSTLPSFTGISSEHTEKLGGRIQVGPDIDYLERAFDAAKYGDLSSQPYLELKIASLSDRSLAPEGAHVMSIHAQFAPYKLTHGDWNSRREEVGDAVVDTLSEYAPDLKQLIVGRRVITPLDLENKYGFRGGHIHHGELSLDQFFAFRPMIGCAQYRTPIQGLYLCGAGTHPGTGFAGASGANASREVIKDLKK